MNKVRFHYGYPINLDILTEKEVDVYIDRFPMEPVAKGTIRIVILEEPKKTELYRFAKTRSHLYTHLLTFHEDLLKSNPKAIRFHSMTAWVRDYKPEYKVFVVSTVVGGKRDKGMKGYALRHELWKNRNRITIPKKFYLSGNAKHKHTFVPWKAVDYTNELVLGDKKEPMFDCMFHIAIENTSIANYFSEKLVDCFQSYTVPIYYGCTNIGEYFNEDGIIRVKNLRQIIGLCNLLTPEAYNKFKPAMEDNFKRSMKWLDNQEQIKNKILEII